MLVEKRHLIWSYEYDKEIRTPNIQGNYDMSHFDLPDVKKMPLGKVSKSQIAKGFDILDEIEKALSAKATARLKALSSSFYTVIPHDFGRRPPPVIKDLNTLRSKMNMLLVQYRKKNSLTSFIVYTIFDLITTLCA